MPANRVRKKLSERVRALNKYRQQYLRLDWFSEGCGVHPCKKPTNKTEAKFYEQMADAGWFVMRSGWPDFLCFRGHEICVVEVKPKKDESLRGNQLIVMNTLAHFGITCYRWDGEKGFAKITEQNCRCVKSNDS